MVLCEFSMSPIGKGESLSKEVARIIRVIDESGIAYKVYPMGTVIEGEWDEVMAVITACYREMSQHCNRISVSAKIDARKGTESRMESKVDAVMAAIGKAADSQS